MQKKTLLIMAAGMGSRFGGLKQIEPIGPNGEFLIDYSIYDAINEGFNKVVFVIKEENLEIFKETVGNRIANKIEVEYAFQKVEDIPKNIKIFESRIKPWGTSQAVLCAKDKINESFVIINADDFYGRDSFKVASDFINTKSDDYAVIGYKVKNTLSPNGSVKRAVCEEIEGKLKKLTESSIEKNGSKIVATPLSGENSFIVAENDLVSMNMLIFNESIFPFLEKEFDLFLEKNQDNILNCEFLIPETLYKAKIESYRDVVVLSTDAKWYGVTYREDKDSVVKAINRMIENGVYPKMLWK